MYITFSSDAHDISFRLRYNQVFIHFRCGIAKLRLCSVNFILTFRPSLSVLNKAYLPYPSANSWLDAFVSGFYICIFRAQILHF
jgi:hypothetical protein